MPVRNRYITERIEQSFYAFKPKKGPKILLHSGKGCVLRPLFQISWKRPCGEHEFDS